MENLAQDPIGACLLVGLVLLIFIACCTLAFREGEQQARDKLEPSRSYWKKEATTMQQEIREYQKQIKSLKARLAQSSKNDTPRDPSTGRFISKGS